MTLAPELPGAVSAIRRLVVAGIAVSAGHSDATEQEAAAGFAACITQTTHLHNAMSSLRKTNPPRPGLAEAALAAPGILCELIADGIHVPDDLLAGAVAAKGWEGIALVSDATAGAGLCEGAFSGLEPWNAVSATGLPGLVGRTTVAWPEAPNLSSRVSAPWWSGLVSL